RRLPLAGTAAPLERGLGRGGGAEGGRAAAGEDRGVGRGPAERGAAAGGLRDAADAPWALIGRGSPDLIEGLEPYRAVTIVGARRATSYGREVSRELGRELARAGMVVVSGMAFGIDGCAHRGALDGGRTIAVLGCGPDVAYPASHRALWRQISESGLVLSE